MSFLKQIHKRMKFAYSELSSYFDLGNIIFSDEARVSLGPDNRLLWRRYGQNSDNIFSENIHFPPGLMIWGSIGKNYKSPLIIIKGTLDSKKYIDLLKESNVIQDIQRMSETEPYLYMHDGASCHSATQTMEFIRQFVRVIDKWPANSPDLNPIERLWGILKYIVKSKNITNLDQLEGELQYIWSTISMKTVNKLFASFRLRLMLLVSQEGRSITDLLRRGCDPEFSFSDFVIPENIQIYDRWYAEVDNSIQEPKRENDRPYEIADITWSTWSSKQKTSYLKLRTQQNSYFDRHVSPGITMKMGPFTSEEKRIFMIQIQQRRAIQNAFPISDWGLFAQSIPGRVGYQCANFFRLLQKNGEFQ